MKDRHAVSISTCLSIAALLVACQSGPFSGSGSMRIEVEVYKGPLSQEPEIQWGELVGYIEEAKRSIVENANFTLSVVANKGLSTLDHHSFSPIDVNAHEDLNPHYLKTVPAMATASGSGAASYPSHDDKPIKLTPMYLYPPSKGESSNATNDSKGTPTRTSMPGAPQDSKANSPFRIDWCDGLNPAATLGQLDFFDCVILRGIYTDSLDLIREVNHFLSDEGQLLHGPTLQKEQAKQMLQEIAEMSTEFRAKAFRWAVATTAGQSFNLAVRIALHNFVVIASEYGNQLQARADSLLKQREDGYLDRRELSLSSYIRDSQPTDFVRLYDWLGASTDSLRYKIPDFMASGHWPSSVRERIKIVDRLYADHYWSKINTVYASGKGKVSMAFVKDDIGNWDLKNMDNAPGELLSAYTDFASSIAKKGTDIATAYFTGGTSEALGRAKLFIEEARAAELQINGNPSAGLQAGQRLEELQHDTGAAIQKLWQDRQADDATLVQQYEKSKGTDQDNASLERLRTHRQNTYALLSRVAQEYKDNVDIMGKATERLAGKERTGHFTPFKEVTKNDVPPRAISPVETK